MQERERSARGEEREREGREGTASESSEKENTSYRVSLIFFSLASIFSLAFIVSISITPSVFYSTQKQGFSPFSNMFLHLQFFLFFSSNSREMKMFP